MHAPRWLRAGAWLIGAVGGIGTSFAGVVTGRIVDEATGRPVPARVYLESEAGRRFHVSPAEPAGAAVPYAKTNWLNPRSVEVHTTVSAHGFRAELPDGTYLVTVEKGKEYRPRSERFEIRGNAVELRLSLRRWVDAAALGWYSGETHLHRTVEELRTVLPAEDLNVGFPLSFWVTKGDTAPGTGDKNMPGDFPAALEVVDPAHVIWPRNTEYEIFSMAGRPHTLGALFILNHRSVLDLGAPPWGPIARRAREEGALMDMDTLDWAFSFLLPPVTGAGLYELANNHMWRTEYAFTNYVSAAPPYLHPPYGQRRGSERDWTLYTWGMYYTLQNAGFPVVPAAGTASGVHPVPAGFSRVYVHLPEGFEYGRWLRGLQDGRSFVTTGPMLFAQMDGQDPGATWEATGSRKLRMTGRVLSEERLAFVEILQDGIPVRTVMGRNRETPEGARETTFEADVEVRRSGWIAARCWEERADGRFRWAHTAPWHVVIDGQPRRPRAEEKEFLVRRMELEIERSRPVLSEIARRENESALATYRALAPLDDSLDVARQARRPSDDASLKAWLQNMIGDHGFTLDEARQATGLSRDELRRALDRFGIRETPGPARGDDGRLRVLPYPGGRHPRLGFLDGALNPQRDTKISVFTPWDPRAYVVVDVPEAIWSNLGLTYLAHEHVATLWTKAGVVLAPLEWQRRPEGVLEIERTLPNGIEFGTRVEPGRDAVRMTTWIRNGTTNVLTGLRAQNCVMLKGAAGFHAQTDQNKVLRPPYAACRSEDGRRWVVTAWDGLDRAWQNPPVPCLHSDPKFPDCPPGARVEARGVLWFYEGTDVEAEIARIEASGWRGGAATTKDAGVRR